MCVCVSLCAKDEYLSPFITVLFLAARGKVEMGCCARDFWINLSDFATQFFWVMVPSTLSGTLQCLLECPSLLFFPFARRYLLSHGMFLFCAVITVIGCVPFCMSSTLDARTWRLTALVWTSAAIASLSVSSPRCARLRN